MLKYGACLLTNAEEKQPFFKEIVGGPEKGLWVFLLPVAEKERLASKTVQSTALALQGVDDVHGSDGLPFSVLGVGHSIADHVLQEHLQHPAGFFVDEARNTLHASTTSQATDRRLRYALDVVPQHLPMPFGASFPEPFSSFPTTRHVSI